MKQSIVMVVGVFAWYLFFSTYLPTGSSWEISLPVAFADDDDDDDEDDDLEECLQELGEFFADLEEETTEFAMDNADLPLLEFETELQMLLDDFEEELAELLEECLELLNQPTTSGGTIIVIDPQVRITVDLGAPEGSRLGLICPDPGVLP